LGGQKWFYAFMRRNPQLSVRQPEGTSLARAKGFNRGNVLHFFDLLESSIAKFVFTFDKICNVDESGFSTVQKRPQETVAAVLLTLPSHLPLKFRIQEHLWTRSLTQKSVTTVGKMKITNHLVRE
jgi:hypothetical protein